jgi:L-ascorbate metabolism protein UlaG (beta-lactamase superfamily)
MVITYNGVEFFKMQFGDTVLAFNPISKDSAFKSSKFGADICLISLNHPDFNGVENVTFGDKAPFVIQGPGEYEVKEIFVQGFESHSSYGGAEVLNTLYYLTLDGMKICFLGAIDTKELKTDTVESLGDIDILFVPIGGKGMLNASDAYKLAVKLEAKMIIPMFYEEEDDRNSLKTFLKEGGVEGVKLVDKLTIKKKDLEGKEGEIVVLSATT